MDYCIFSKTKWNVIFFFQERWGTSLSSFPIQTTYSLASEINGTGSFQGTEREKQDPYSLPPLPASLAYIAASLITQYSNPLSLGPLQQPTGDRPFPDPCVYTEIKSQGHLIHPSIAKKRRAPDMETSSRSLPVPRPSSHFL